MYALVIGYVYLDFSECSLCMCGLWLRTATALPTFTCIYSSVWSTLDKTALFINEVIFLFNLYIYFLERKCVCLCITSERIYVCMLRLCV